jgi:hypothetical protein
MIRLPFKQYLPMLWIRLSLHLTSWVDNLTIERNHTMPLLPIGDLLGHIQVVHHQCVLEGQVEGWARLLSIDCNQIEKTLGLWRRVELAVHRPFVAFRDFVE